MPEGAVLFEVDDEGLVVPVEVPWGLVNAIFANSGDEPHVLFVSDTGIVHGVFLAPGAHVEALVEYAADRPYSIAELFGTSSPRVEFVATGPASPAVAPSADVSVVMVQFEFSVPDRVEAGPHWWELPTTANRSMI